VKPPGAVELLFDNEGLIGNEVRRFLRSEMFVNRRFPRESEQVRRAGIFREVIAVKRPIIAS